MRVYMSAPKDLPVDNEMGLVCPMYAMTLALPLSRLFFACHRREHSERRYQLQPIHKIVLGGTRARNETASWAGSRRKYAP